MLSRHVVLVPDIVRLVFNEVGDEDKPTLARSARCCRAFHDAALDVLWKNLESVDPLRGLLPERGLGDDGTPASISEEQWKRFDSYAQRVKTWVFDKGGLDAIFYCHLATIRPGVVPFPALRELQLFERIDTPPFFLFPPLLRYLNINFSYWKSNGPRYGELYLIAAIDQVPTLEELKFYGPVPLTTLARCKELKCLRILKLNSAELSLGSITILSSLPGLAVLELPTNPLRSEDISPHTGFHQLEALTLSGHPSIIAKLLETITTPKLRVIAIHNSPFDMHPGSATEWNLCFECIRDRFGFSLRVFEINAVAAVDGMSVIELLEPLMKIHQLEQFSLNHLVRSLHISTILAIASAWPHLRRFALDTPRILVSLPDSGEISSSHLSNFSPTLHCLASLAKLCPKLLALSIFIPIDDEDTFPPISQFSALPHNLEHLRLLIETPSPVKDYMPLARLLDPLFPALEAIHVTAFGQSSFDDTEFIRMLQATRRERCLL